MQQINSKRQWIAPACGVLGVIAAVWVYWMILPGLILGAVAVVLGWRTRRNGASERGSVAIALGIVAISRALGPIHRRRCEGLGSGLCVGPDP